MQISYVFHIPNFILSSITDRPFFFSVILFIWTSLFFLWSVQIEEEDLYQDRL